MLAKQDEWALANFKTVARSPGAVVGGFDSHTPLPRLHGHSWHLPDTSADSSKSLMRSIGDSRIAHML
jgi:hypothetical protein